jgi:hypothetical protein
VLGRRTSVCTTLDLLIDLFLVWEEFIPWVDPWGPVIDLPTPVVPWFDPEPVMAVALGGAIVALRDTFPYPTNRASDLNDKAREILQATLKQLDSEKGGRLHQRPLVQRRLITISGPQSPAVDQVGQHLSTQGRVAEINQRCPQTHLPDISERLLPGEAPGVVS